MVISRILSNHNLFEMEQIIQSNELAVHKLKLAYFDIVNNGLNDVRVDFFSECLDGLIQYQSSYSLLFHCLSNCIDINAD